MMVGTAVLILPLMRSGFALNRWEGALLLASYFAYIYSLMP
jgi:Ca2+/Na+ antiporter